MKRVLLTCIGVAAMGIAFAQDAAPADKPANDAKPAAPQNVQKGRENYRKQMIKRLEDGMAQVVEIYDANKNGKLDPDEKALADKELDFTELSRKMRLSRSYANFKIVDTDGDGVLSEKEKEEAPAKITRNAQNSRRGPGVGGDRGNRALPQGKQAK